VAGRPQAPYLHGQLRPPLPLPHPLWPPAAVTEAPLAAPVEIEYWYGLGGHLGEVVESMIAAFNESQAAVHVTGVVFPDYVTTAQRLQAAIAAQTPPPAVMLNSTTANEFLLAGVLSPLDDLVAAYPDFNLEDYPYAYRAPMTAADGHIYGIPIMGTSQILYYRKDIFAQLGINPDMLNTWETLAEMAAQCRTVDAAGNITRYGWEPMWGSGNLIDASYSNGARILSEDGRTVLIDQPEWIQVWEAFRTWIHVDQTMRIHSGGEGWAYWYDTIDDVLQGRSCGYTGSPGDQGDLDFSIVAAHVQPYWQEWGNLDPIANGHVAVIPLGVTPELAQAAFEWIRFCTSPENAARWSVETGYLPARTSASEQPILVDFAVDHPQILVPVLQAADAQPAFIDPAGGKITDALDIATDQVEIEGIPAAEALARRRLLPRRRWTSTGRRDRKPGPLAPHPACWVRGSAEVQGGEVLPLPPHSMVGVHPMDNVNPFSQPGRWFKGNLHTHSTVSDGLLTPDQVVDFYRGRGYHFLAFTEHRIFTEGKPFTGGDFITLNGIEVDGLDPQAGLYHLIGLGQSRPPTAVLEGGTSMQAAIDSLRSVGGQVFLAHPYWSGQMSKNLLTMEGCFGMEIWNGGCEVWDCKGFSTVHWDDLLAAGRRLWGVGADDCHWWEGRADAGLGWVWVKAETLTQDALLAALERGCFYASSGPEIHEVGIEGDQVRARCSPVTAIDFIGSGPLSRRVIAPAGETMTEAVHLLKPAYSFRPSEYLRIACRDLEGNWAWSNPVFS
jgi:multiple sugar transport system substrate-binding protein